jgi:glycosyltransferase involved in cell wall biosynthesis
MNVLVVSNLYPPAVFGGYEIICRQVVEGLKARGHRVAVLTSSFGAEAAPAEPGVERSLALTTSFPRPGEEVGFVDFRLHAMHRVARRNRALTLARIDADPPDVVFCWSLNRLSLGPICAAQARHVPVCYALEDEHPKQFRSTRQVDGMRALCRYAAERWLWPMATFRLLKPFSATVNSEALKRALIAQGVPVEHAQVVYHGVPLDQFPFRPSPRVAGTSCQLLYVGQLSRVKGVHTLLRAAGLLLRSGEDFQLDIVGSGVPSYERTLRKISRAEGVDQRVNYAGQVAHDEIPQVYQRHHVLAFPSEWEEPFGLTHLEAMASGCAVVSTRTGGSAELIRYGQNALAFQAGDAQDLAAKLRGLMRDEAARQALIRRARAWVEARHAFDLYLREVESLLRAATAPALPRLRGRALGAPLPADAWSKVR